MTIGEYLYIYDRDTYLKLKNLCKKEKKENKKIELGDTAENLMKHDSYRRVKGALRQTKWG